MQTYTHTRIYTHTYIQTQTDVLIHTNIRAHTTYLHQYIYNYYITTYNYMHMYTPYTNKKTIEEWKEKNVKPGYEAMPER